jgi:limonene-1,2-epoxide hydrolase
MSDENVEVVLALYEAFNRRDEQAVVALYHPQARIISFAAAVEGTPEFVGEDGVRAWFRNLVDTLSMRIEEGVLLPYRSYVLTIPRIHTEVGDGLKSTHEQGILYEIQNGRIKRSLGYKDAATAFITLGRLLGGAVDEAAAPSE